MPLLQVLAQHKSCFQTAFPKGNTSHSFLSQLNLVVIYINGLNSWFQIPSTGVLSGMCSEFQQPLGALCCHIEGLVCAGCVIPAVSQGGLDLSSSLMITSKSVLLCPLVHLLSQILGKGWPVHMPKPFLLGRGCGNTPGPRQELGGPAGVCTLSVPAPSPSHRGKMDSSRWASDLDPVILVGSFQLRTFCHSAILICVLGTSHLCLQQAWPPSTGVGRAAPNPLLLSLLGTRTALLHLWDSCP